MASRPSDFEAQLERLLDKEKTARVNNDHPVSVLILKDIITLCYQAQEWQRLNEQITFLMNRRGQSKKAQIEMIQLAMTWLPKTAQPQRTRLIEAIRDVCAKKIFLEVEYARCVMLIVRSKEDENDISEAAAILQEVQVETYGSMDKRQKLQFILYQMRIMLKKQDYVRFYIISKKINQNNINQAEIADLKVLFYSYMAIYYNHQNNYPQACRCYRILHPTLKIKSIPETLDFNFSARPVDVLSNYIGFLALQPYSEKNHQQLLKLSEQEQIEKHPACLKLITSLLSEQIVPCVLDKYSPSEFELFRDSFPNHQNHLDQLKRMLVQHNIRIISKYYGELTLERVSQLLEVEKDYCEEQLCTLNNNHTISCRIDRIDGIIDFKPVQNEQFLLKNWNKSINSILDLVDVTTNLIHREREVHKK